MPTKLAILRERARLTSMIYARSVELPALFTAIAI
jgi:hypothetical protein